MLLTMNYTMDMATLQFAFDSCPEIIMIRNMHFVSKSHSKGFE